jgi:hypothetical protein
MLNFTDGSLEDKLLTHFDADGQIRALVTALEAVAGLLNRTTAAELRKTVSEMDRLVRLMAEAIRELAPLGWAPSSFVPAEGYKVALEHLSSGDREGAERALTDAWEGWIWEMVPGQLAAFAADDPVTQKLFGMRARLVRLAIEHHRARRYDASIPILLAQIEGLCADATGLLFFSRSPQRAAEVVDARSLAGFDEALPRAREWWCNSSHTTGSFGQPLRHPVLHGRELSYDTEVNSTKSLVLLLSVMEWARPIVDASAAAARLAREEANAGSEDVDGLGRRVDDREFEVTRRALQRVLTAQFGRSNNLGRYLGEELEAVLAPTFRELPHPSGIHIRCSDDGGSWWAWRRTVSGYVLGIGGNAPTPNTWYYEGTDEPGGPPGTCPGWGEAAFESTSNW